MTPTNRPLATRWLAPWPTPHDPVFDFTTTPPEYAWLDSLAREGAGELEPPGRNAVVGHSEWVCHNVRYAGAEVVAAYD